MLPVTKTRPPLDVALPIEFHGFANQFGSLAINSLRIGLELFVNRLGYIDRYGLHTWNLMYGPEKSIVRESAPQFVSHIIHRFGIVVPPESAEIAILKQIRIAILIVIVGLVISGVTAFPLLHELNLLCGLIEKASAVDTDLGRWVFKVREGLANTYRDYPFIAYGTDWLAFGHLMIALFFILPYRDPVRYEGVLRVGIAVSLLVIPLAFICGPIRGIPVLWRLIDCSFGVLCIPPLVFALRKIRLLDGVRA